MSEQVNVKAYNAEAAIAAYTIVKPGAADQGILHATAASEKLMGITTECAAATGDVADVVLAGMTYLVLGGTVAQGDPITADSNGAGVVANPATGANAYVIAEALQGGVSGDVIKVLITRYIMQGA